MSDLFDGLFDLLGEAASKVAEIAVESAGAIMEGTVSAAGAVAESAGPAIAGAAGAAGELAGATAQGVRAIALLLSFPLRLVMGGAENQDQSGTGPLHAC